MGNIVNIENNPKTNGSEDSANNIASTANRKVSSIFCNPVDFIDDEGKIITVTEGEEITQNNKIISSINDSRYFKFKGYLGFTRFLNGKMRPHTGYDYIAKVGETKVKAVHYGKIYQIRFGKTTGKCGLLEYFIRTGNFSFKKEDIDVYNKDKEEKEKIYYCGHVYKYKDKEGKEIVEKCSDNCFGLQVWIEILGISEKLYAYYAHLSKLNEEVFKDRIFKEGISEERIQKINFEETKHTLILNDPEINKEVKCGEEIGISGDTGNAITAIPKHLHFECRTGIETHTQISPNKIVETEFRIKNIRDGNETEDISLDDLIKYSFRNDIKKNEESYKSERKKRGISEAVISLEWEKHEKDECEKMFEKYQKKIIDESNATYLNTKALIEYLDKLEKNNKLKRYSRKIEDEWKNAADTYWKKWKRISNNCYVKKRKEFSERGETWNAGKAWEETTQTIEPAEEKDWQNGINMWKEWNKYIKDSCYAKKRKEFSERGETWNAGKAWEEYYENRIREKITITEKQFQEIYITEKKMRKLDNDSEALYLFKENHRLIVGKIDASKCNKNTTDKYQCQQ